MSPTPPITVSAVAARQRRWREFLAPGAKPGFLFLIRWPDDSSLPPAPPKSRRWMTERIEHKWQAYERDLRRAALVDDDWVPSLGMSDGTEIFAEALGSPVHLPEDGMPFALPRIHSAAEVAALPVPELSASSLAYLFDMADELRRRAGPGAVLKMVDVQSPVDIAALVWEKAAFLMAMLDAPEAVHELTAKTGRILMAFLDEWFRRYGTDFTAHYPDYAMSGGLTLSEDEVGAVNAEAFREFFRPGLVALSTRYGGIGIHCCADARHQWANFRDLPGLRFLNLNKPPTRSADYTRDAYRFFTDTCAQLHFDGWQPEGPLETWPGQYPAGSRVVIEVQAEDLAAAQALAARYQEIRAATGG